VSVSAVTDVSEDRSPNFIRRENVQRKITVTANVAELRWNHAPSLRHLGRILWTLRCARAAIDGDYHRAVKIGRATSLINERRIEADDLRRQSRRRILRLERSLNVKISDLLSVLSLHHPPCLFFKLLIHLEFVLIDPVVP
jgi:hypothetical protein